ncbi:hypothetical protein F4821DRAFT_215794 [Hypoxylon rubiginosum]|uniref:Uncharacterized protein n=1 Tax=Hypoxylon rubiginosum TaxID=110542 RepID=A0ACC0CPQ0_9PEZI|nr:hypothetical protein F4821DRAFT_215794 [Hypoxylon rubiginosum]
MVLLQVVAKAREFIDHLVSKYEMNTINWAEELRLIGCACLLYAIIVISGCALSEKLSQYPIWNSAVNILSSYFYQPSPRLRRGPIGGRRTRPPNRHANLDDIEARWSESTRVLIYNPNRQKETQ